MEENRLSKHRIRHKPDGGLPTLNLRNERNADQHGDSNQHDISERQRKGDGDAEVHSRFACN